MRVRGVCVCVVRRCGCWVIKRDPTRAFCEQGQPRAVKEQQQ
jgi:hypothetical protein